MQLFGDGSPRTSRILVPTWITCAAVLTIFATIIWFFVGRHSYQEKLNGASTPVGSVVTFSKSKAALKLTGIYTDSDHSVILARLTPERGAKNLPFRGTDYKVMVTSPAFDATAPVPLLFGRVSTDGDFLFALPNPGDAVYNIGLVPSSRPSLDDLDIPQAAANTDPFSEEDVASLGRSLSQMANDTTGVGKENTAEDNKKSAPQHDIGSFRLTLNPSMKEEKYQPTTINGSLIDPDTGSFDFEKVFSAVYVNSAVEKLTREYNDLEGAVTIARRDVDDLKTKLSYNESDPETIKELTSAERQLEELVKKQDQKAVEISKYQSIEYDDKIFQNFLTEGLAVKK